MGKKKVLVSYGVDIDAVSTTSSLYIYIDAGFGRWLDGLVPMEEKTLQAI
jgi:hypothetical protein